MGTGVYCPRRQPSFSARQRRCRGVGAKAGLATGRDKDARLLTVGIKIVAKTGGEEEVGLVLGSARLLPFGPLGAYLQLQTQISGPVVVDEDGRQDGELAQTGVVANLLAEP